MTAESCTGGGIAAALTAISGSSAVFKGGIVSYTNDVKVSQLSVDADLIRRVGPVSAEVAEAMAIGARENLCADVAVSVTGLAGPTGDDYHNPVGTVFVGFSDRDKSFSRRFFFFGDRESIRRQAVKAALEIVLETSG